MEPKIQERIEKTVVRILQESDMEETTEHKIRKQAAAELQLDLSDPPYKAFVKQVVQSFLEQQQQQQLQQQEEEEQAEEEEERGDPRKEYDDDGDLIICRVRFWKVVLRFFIELQLNSREAKRVTFFDCVI